MNMNGNLITDQPAGVLEHYRRATDVAGVCKEIVLRAAKKIQGRSYIQVEGWMAIATAHGCVASIKEIRKEEDGIAAVAELRRIEDGTVLCAAEGFVGIDEPLWEKRPLYARRAMASTRAISRACRSAFAHVVVMMNAGLSTTPAEEMADEEPRSAPAGKPVKGTITEKQLTKLAILCEKTGYSKVNLLAEYNLQSRTQLSKEQASELIERLQEKAVEMESSQAEAGV